MVRGCRKCVDRKSGFIPNTTEYDHDSSKEKDKESCVCIGCKPVHGRSCSAFQRYLCLVIVAAGIVHVLVVRQSQDFGSEGLDAEARLQRGAKTQPSCTSRGNPSVSASGAAATTCIFLYKYISYMYICEDFEHFARCHPVLTAPWQTALALNETSWPISYVASSRDRCLQLVDDGTTGYRLHMPRARSDPCRGHRVSGDFPALR